MLRAAGARSAGSALGLPTAGEGESTATWEVEGDDRRAATLQVAIDTESGGRLTTVSLATIERVAPGDEAW